MWVRLREPAREVKAVGCWGPSVVFRAEGRKGCYWSMVRPWSMLERYRGYGTDPELGAGDGVARSVSTSLLYPPLTGAWGPEEVRFCQSPGLGPRFMTVYFRANRKEKLEP